MPTGRTNTLAVALLIAGYLAVYSAIKGANPLDVLVSTFTGQPLETSLALTGKESSGSSSSVGGSTSSDSSSAGDSALGIEEFFYPAYDPHGGHQDHGHFAHSSISMVIAVGTFLIAKGFDVGEHPAFGGVTPVHVDGSWHYRNRAIDYNWRGPGSEVEMLNKSAGDVRAFLRKSKALTGANTGR